MGNRVLKAYKDDDTLTITYYIRDASGNTMATYKQHLVRNGSCTTSGSSKTCPYTGALRVSEYDLYGSSRLGTYEPAKDDTIATADYEVTFNGTTITIDTPSAPSIIYSHLPVPDTTYKQYGLKSYELNDHLGNVIATVSDRKLYIGTDTVLAYTMPDVLTATDYYPFGMQMVGRTFNGTGHRYGFNGKENDNEVKGTGNSLDFGARIYDSRLGKWFSVDPLQGKYPNLSAYNFVGNNPVYAIDPDGKKITIYITVLNKDGTTDIYVIKKHGFIEEKITEQQSVGIGGQGIVLPTVTNTNVYDGV